MSLGALLPICRSSSATAVLGRAMSAASNAASPSSRAPDDLTASSDGLSGSLPSSSSAAVAGMEPSRFSAFGAGVKETHNVPMSVIVRPLPSLLDEEKVQTFVREVERGDEFTPIEVLRVRSPANPDQSYYFSLGGCHRFEAHKRLGRETIRGKVIEVPASVMKKYLGSSAPF